MKKRLMITLSAICVMATAMSCGNDKGGGGGGGKGDPTPTEDGNLAERNMTRAMALVDAVAEAQLAGDDLLLSEFFNPFTGVASKNGGSDNSIWKYTSVIEAVNAVMKGLEASGDSANFARYADLLDRLYDKMSFYRGTFTLTSFTQTKEWSVYAVPRGLSPNTADVVGDRNRNNVYDDQMWLIRELVESYKLTGNADYLEEAEYLTAYVIDGWDCTLDANGTEHGGISWGPGYVYKHTCSNGPFISPLVWLHEIYKDKADEITYLYIDTDQSRKSRTVKKADYYLDFAERTYKWTRQYLRDASGVYWNMLGGVGDDRPEFETVGGVTYRKHLPSTGAGGTFYTYNAGSVLSGVCDLYRVTGDAEYRADMAALADASYDRFRQPNASRDGYDTWSVALDTYGAWHNGILMRAYVQAAGMSDKAALALDSFQKSLDYGHDNFLEEGFLPKNLIAGWGTNSAGQDVNVMTTCAFAAEYALLAVRELEKTELLK